MFKFNSKYDNNDIILDYIIKKEKTNFKQNIDKILLMFFLKTLFIKILYWGSLDQLVLSLTGYYPNGIKIKFVFKICYSNQKNL